MTEPRAQFFTPTNAQRVDWLRLIRTENVGTATFRKLLNRFGTAEAALDALPRLSARGGRSAPLASPSQSMAEDEIARLDRMGGRLLLQGERGYPRLLSFIAGAPPVLSIKGGDRLDWSRTVGIVGARNASAAGKRLTGRIARDLGAENYLIVSGLARGIDAAAHVAALQTGTVAVLAGGLDKIYPDENAPLAAEILANGGALLSEMPVGWEPRARDFPRRNRLVSGLSLGILVVEAARRSGSLITARLALEQNREVFAVPGSPLDPRAEGPNSLIKDGAALITSAADIIAVLDGFAPGRLPLFEDAEPGFTPDHSAGAPATEPAEDERRSVLEALSITPTPVDDIVVQTGIGVAKVQIILMELDLAGRLEWAGGQLVGLRR